MATKASTAKKAKSADPAPEEMIVSYKGFGMDFACHPGGGERVQYEVGKTFELAGPIAACESGFHACEYPLHVLRYYPASKSRFAVVEQSGQIDRHSEDSKIASSRLTVKAEIDIAGLIKAAIKYTMDRCTPAEGAHATKDNESAQTSGANKLATASGYYGAATASGYYGAATASRRILFVQAVPALIAGILLWLA
jgi:hypothetical protein